MEQSFNNLFQKVGLLVQQVEDERKESQQRGERFNIFQICRIDHYELQHSAIIAEMIDPKGSHGQGELYLKLFMMEYGTKLSIDDIEYDKVEVRREVWTEAHDGRMDIFIEYNGHPLVIIENKLFAKDQSIQLIKYKKDADIKINKSQKTNQEFEYEIVYLSLDGKKASDDSSNGVDYFQMSYSKNIVDWLTQCIGHSARIPLVRETLIQYQNHIKQITNQNMEKDQKDKLLEILSQHPVEYEAILQIDHNEYLKYAYVNYVEGKFRLFASENNLIYKVDGLWERNKEKGFYFRQPNWNHAAIWFFSEASGFKDFYYGVSNYCGEKLGYPSFKLDCMEDDCTEYWPYGTSWMEYDNWDSRVSKAMVTGEFAESVIKSVLAVLEEINTRGLRMD